jgi:peptidyl-prolyl cis-trans isomerase SurA
VSARITIPAAIGLAIALSTALPGRSLEAPAPQPPAAAAGSDTRPVDEAAAALQESEDSRHSDGVAAKVNDTPITNYDVRQRVSLYLATSGQRATPEAIKQIRGQVLKQLETERLELLEAEKNKVTVSASDVDKAIADIMKDNRLTPEQLGKILSEADVRMETLRAQIAAQIAWSKLVQSALGDRVHVSQLDVDDELARLKRGRNEPHYIVSEIFQAVDTPEQDGKVKKDMEDLETQLQQGAPFQAIARQLSQNPTAAQGGDLGTVQKGQLPPELDKVLVTMHQGQISPPIRSSGGYYILLVRAVLEPEGYKDPNPVPQKTYPAGMLPLMRITLPIGPKPTKELAQRAMQAASVMRTQIQGCSNAKDIAAHLQGSVVTDMGLFRLADLGPEMQQAIQSAEPGGAAQPLLSPVGIEVFVRCDPAPPRIGQYRIPPRDAIENQIYEEQITTLARQYLRDLRRDADVETVDKS